MELGQGRLEGVLREGFPGQRMLVLPRPLVRAALELPGTSELLVTDCGYFPHAGHHGRARSHPIDEAVLLICVRGRGWCETEQGRHEVRAGEIVLLPPRTPHAYFADNDDPWTLWWLHLAGRSVSAMVNLIGASVATPVRVPADSYGAALLAAEIVGWMEQDTTEASLVAAAGTAWHLLGLLASSRKPTAGADERIERAAEYLRQHFAARTSVAELASAAGLSSSHFAALFRQRIGVPVNSYQTQLRMARARELLGTTNKSVVEVAKESGYDDAFYFTRQFRKMHGVSPSSYRRQ